MSSNEILSMSNSRNFIMIKKPKCCTCVYEYTISILIMKSINDVYCIIKHISMFFQLSYIKSYFYTYISILQNIRIDK